MNKEKVQELFTSFTSKKILVIGDVMIDSYLRGKVERISPEAPVPIVSCLKRESRLGGAANVALNLEELGAVPVLCGIIGNDDAGTLFLKLMQDNHLSNGGIYIVKGRPTSVKTRIIGSNQQLVRVDEESDKPIEGKHEAMFLEHIEKYINNTKIDAVIFQDYDKGAITQKIIQQIVTLATQKNIPILVDPKKRNFHNYSGVTLFKPNFKEFCDGLKVELAKDDFEKVAFAAKKFQQQQNISILLLTLSEKGMLISSNNDYFHTPAHVRDISDVSGAGDTVISVASLCLSCGLSPKTIASISNLAGGLVCEKVGVVPIEKKRLQEEINLLNLEEES